MEVLIDGIEYVPAAPECDDAGPLETRMFVADLDSTMTLREYLQALLQTLWNEGEGFSGKRPFGNSGWEYTVYAFLVKSGAVSGHIDEDGHVDGQDNDECNVLMPGLIAAAFGLTK